MLNETLKLDKYIFTSKLEKVATRDGYGDGVVEAGKKDENVVVLCADLTESTRNENFKKEFPERFFQVGVAEQNMAGIGTGLALSGKIPFVASYAVFSPGRNWEQIRIACYSKANLKIIGAHAGLSVGPDGATHQALEDIALMRVLPNMVVINPADYHEAKKATLAVAEHVGPVYIRLARNATPVFSSKETPFEIGKAQIINEGRDVTIVATGTLVYEALKAAKELELAHHISCEVINCATIKPLDEKTILESAKKTRRIITLEEHQVTGGLGGAVAELLSQKLPTPIKIMGVQDSFGESGQAEELWEKYGLSAQHVEIEVKNFMQKV